MPTGRRPDRPIVIGSVYNGTNTVPMDSADKKKNSGILTRSSTGGNGYNMLLFDDTAGSERQVRGREGLMFKALNNEQRDIVHNQTENVGTTRRSTSASPPAAATGP